MALRPLLYLAAALAFLPSHSAQAAPSINSLTSANIKTMQASSEIVTENQDQLKTIDGDIALAYRLHRGAMTYEQPGKLRIEASIPHFVSGYYIINGNQKLTVAPFVHKVQDTTGAPGKRQTLMDFGLIPPELLADYNATFLRREGGLDVFQIQPKQVGETEKDIVWIDPKTHITVQRYNYGRDGKLTKILHYINPIQVAPGIYVPTRVELYNTQNKLAGATVYENIRVNQPVSDSPFQDLMTANNTKAFQEETSQAIRRFDHFDLAAGGLLVFLTLFRFWYDGRHELLQDEAYYWQWSRHLDWGYYDNTPLMAPIIRLFTLVLGTNELGVRAGATVCAFVAGLFVYLLAKRLLGPVVALAAVALTNSIPLFAAGSVIMTQDPVQLAFWAAALYVVQRALTDRPTWWIGAGVLAGLAAEAKLNALLLLPSIFLYILLSPSARVRWLRRPEPYLAGVVALALLAPFFWWNHTHQNAFWIHAHAMSSRGSGHDGLKWVGRFLGDQALLISPLVFLTYLSTLFSGWKRGVREHDDAVLFLWCPAVAAFVAIVVTALKSKVEGNWAVDSYISGLILTAAVLVRCWESREVLKRIWVGLSAALALLLTIAALFPSLLYGVGIKFPKPAADRTNELYGWRAMAARITREKSAMGGDPFVFGINYRMPSEAAFYLPGHPQTDALFLNYKASEYMFWENPSALVGRDAIFLNDTDNQDHFNDLRAVFTRVEPQPPLLVWRNPPYAVPVRTVQIVRCYGFRGYDVKRWQDGW